MRTIYTLHFFLVVTSNLFAQELPKISEPPGSTLYRWYGNLVQLKLDPYDYNEYMISCEHCEVIVEDKNGEKLAPNNFMLTFGWEFEGNSLELELWDLSKPDVVLKTFSFKVVNPPVPLVHLDGIESGGKCSRTPKKFTTELPAEAPIRMFSDIDNWQMIIDEQIVYGDGDEINDYARSILAELPSGTKIEFKCRSIDQEGRSGYLHAEFTLE